jgi:hypothetical protein
MSAVPATHLAPRTRATGALVTTLALLMVALGAGPAAGSPAVGGDRPTSIRMEQVWGHLEVFQAIADTHGGNRSAGTPGYDASVEHVAATLEAAGFEVSFDRFDISVPVEVAAPSLVLSTPSHRAFTPGTDFAVARPAAVVDVVDAPLAAVGTSTGSTTPGSAAGCAAQDYATFPLGSVALVALGGCTAWQKVDVALRNGAVAVALVGDGPVADAVELMAPRGGAVWSVSRPVGDELYAALAAGEVTLSLDTGWDLEPRPTASVIAERAGADPAAGTLMLGAHLDSVGHGPGINDNATGAAVLLGLAQGLGDRPTDPGLRLGFWAAEEHGLVGARHYVTTAPAGELTELVAYLNVDMVASPNWATFVYDPALAVNPSAVSPGSAELTARFRSWFDERGLPSLSIWTNGRTDDAAFSAAGVPVGGLVSGGEGLKSVEQAEHFGGVPGQPFDPCYHLSCDDLSNIAGEALTVHAAAIEGVTQELLGLVEPRPVPEPAPSSGPALVPAFTG